VRDDGPLTPEERVEQRRLAAVGASGDDRQGAFPQPLSLARRVDQIPEPTAQPRDGVSDPLRRHGAAVFLGEVDLVGHQRFQLQHPIAQLPDTVRQAAVELAERRTALGRRRSLDEIPDRLGLQ
jgi:hypothetical protein